MKILSNKEKRKIRAREKIERLYDIRSTILSRADERRDTLYGMGSALFRKRVYTKSDAKKLHNIERQIKKLRDVV